MQSFCFLTDTTLTKGSSRERSTVPIKWRWWQSQTQTLQQDFTMRKRLFRFRKLQVMQFLSSFLTKSLGFHYIYCSKSYQFYKLYQNIRLFLVEGKSLSCEFESFKAEKNHFYCKNLSKKKIFARANSRGRIFSQLWTSCKRPRHEL